MIHRRLGQKPILVHYRRICQEHKSGRLLLSRQALEGTTVKLIDMSISRLLEQLSKHVLRCVILVDRTNPAVPAVCAGATPADVTVDCA